MKNKNQPPLIPIPEGMDSQDPFGIHRNEIVPNLEIDNSSLVSRFKNRFNVIRSGYNGLTENQKDMMQIGAIALLPAVMPAIEVISDGENATEAGQFLQAYGIGALTAGATLGWKNTISKLKKSQ